METAILKMHQEGYSCMEIADYFYIDTEAVHQALLDMGEL